MCNVIRQKETNCAHTSIDFLSLDVNVVPYLSCNYNYNFNQFIIIRAITITITLTATITITITQSHNQESGQKLVYNNVWSPDHLLFFLLVAISDLQSSVSNWRESAAKLETVEKRSLTFARLNKCLTQLMPRLINIFSRLNKCLT